MEISTTIILHIILAAILGGLIGLERKQLQKEAGVRTHALLAVGATLFTSISLYGLHDFAGAAEMDISRIMSQIVTGAGFIGAGIIIFHDKRVHGLTTAAGLWVSAAIGMAIGVGWLTVAIATTLIVLFLLHIVGGLFRGNDEKE